MNPEVKAMIVWWERRRILYNLLIIGFSTFLCYQFWDYPWRKIVGSEAIVRETVLFILGLNFLYLITWGWAALLFYTSKSKGLSVGARWAVFGLYTFISLALINFFHVFQFDVLFA